MLYELYTKSKKFRALNFFFYARGLNDPETYWLISAPDCSDLNCIHFSVLSKVFELGPILANLTKNRRLLVPKSLASAENWLNCQEKASFVLILTKPVEPKFRSAGPILGHTALLEGTLIHLYSN